MYSHHQQTTVTYCGRNSDVYIVTKPTIEKKHIDLERPPPLFAVYNKNDMTPLIDTFKIYNNHATKMLSILKKYNIDEEAVVEEEEEALEEEESPEVLCWHFENRCATCVFIHKNRKDLLTSVGIQDENTNTIFRFSCENSVVAADTNGELLVLLSTSAISIYRLYHYGETLSKICSTHTQEPGIDVQLIENKHILVLTSGAIYINFFDEYRGTCIKCVHVPLPLSCYNNNMQSIYHAFIYNNRTIIRIVIGTLDETFTVVDLSCVDFQILAIFENVRSPKCFIQKTSATISLVI